MKNSITLLGTIVAILAAFATAANAQVSVNGTSETTPYDLSTSNQVAGANGSLVLSSGNVTESAPYALIGTGNGTSPYQFNYQFNYQVAGGTLTLSQSNADFAAPIALDGGTLDATATGALGSSAVDLLYTGTLNLSATNALSGNGSITEVNQFQSVQINITAAQNYSGATTTAAWNQNPGNVALVISGNGNLSNSTINAVGPNSTVDLETTNAITGGTLNFLGATISETAPNAISGTTAVNMYASNSNAILSAANNYTGATTVVGGSNPTQINGYFVFGAALDFSEANSPVTNIINSGVSHANISSGSGLVLSGGNFSVVGANGVANSQEFNGLMLTAGNSSLIANAGTTGGSMTVAVNNITRQTGSIINFNTDYFGPNGTGTAVITTTTANANFAGGQATILGGWATVGNEYWATSSADGLGGTGSITAMTTGSTPIEFTMPNGQDVEVDATSGGTTATSMNSLRFGAGSSDIALVAPLTTIATGGILVADFNNDSLIEGPNDDLLAGSGLTGPFDITSGNGQDLDIIFRDSSDGLIMDDNIVDNGGTPIGVTTGGAGGTLTLGGVNTFTGNLTINVGTVVLNSQDALDGHPVVVFGGDGGVSGGNLELNGNNATVSGITQATGQGYAVNGGFNIYNGNASNTATFTVDNATNDVFDGGISDNAPNQSGSASLDFVKDGAGELDLTTSVYNNNDRVTLGWTGATTINEGLLYLGASTGSSYLTNTSIISVNGGGSIGGNSVTVGHAFTNGPSTGALGEFQGVQVAGGSTATTQGSINLQDGTSTTFRIAQDSGQTGLYIGGAAGNPGNISLDVGLNPASGAGADELALQYYSNGYTSGNTVNSGNIYIAPGGFNLNLNGLGNLQGTPFNPITIMEVGGFDTTSTGFGGNTYGTGYDTFADAIAGGGIKLNTTGNNSGYVISLTSYNDPNGGFDLGIIETANATPTTAYFSGAVGASGNAWNTFTGGNANNSNWTSSDGGADTNQSPGAQTDVFFGTAPTDPNALAAYLNNDIGADTTIKSLTFTSNSTGNITIGDATHILTVEGNSGNGITVDSGAGAETITANVNLGSSQTWTNNSTNTLTVTGDIMDHDLSGGNMNTSHAYSLTKAGTGALNLGGVNSYSGGTTVQGGKLIVTNTLGSGTGSGGVLVENTATLAGTGIIAPSAGNNVELQNGATLSPGLNATGALNFDLTAGSSLIFDAGSALSLNLGTSSTDVAFVNEGNFLSGSGNATLELNLGAGFNYHNTYTVFDNTSSPLFDFSSITGYDSTDYTAELEINGANETLSFSPNAEAVPEPSTWALILAGIGGLLFFRRKSKQA